MLQQRERDLVARLQPLGAITDATVFRACVAPLVNAVSSGDAPMKRATVERASS